MSDGIMQGDILLTPVRELPPNLKVKESGSRVTLALGETSGHAHVVEAVNAPQAREKQVLLYEDERGNMWLEVKAPATLKHITVDGSPTRDHAWGDLGIGVYEYIHQTEALPTEGIRHVQD